MSMREILAEELETLRTLRDEVRVQVHLGKRDASDVWERLENDWDHLQQRVRENAESSLEAAEEVRGTLRELSEELRNGYEQLRDAISRQPGLRVKDAMTRDPVMLKAGDHLNIADDVMSLGRIRHLPVLDEDDELVGLVSQRDLFRGALAKVLGYGETARERLYTAMSVREVMTTPVKTIAPEAKLSEAARRMIDEQIGCLVVVDEFGIAGILTESDLLTLVASRAA